MANTTKKNTTKKTTTNVKTTTSVADKKIAQLEEMVKKLMEQNEFLMNQNRGTQEIRVTQDNNASRMIKVVSLCSNKLYLTEGEHGEGKSYIFNKLGATRMIPANILDNIVSAHLSLAEKGYFYICDSQFVREHGLEAEYQNFKTPEVMDTFINSDKRELNEILTTCNVEQLKTIVDVIIEKILNKEITLEDFEDDGRANVVNKVCREAFKNNEYNLRSKVEDLQELTNKGK